MWNIFECSSKLIWLKGKKKRAQISPSFKSSAISSIIRWILISGLYQVLLCKRGGNKIVEKDCALEGE